jgi:hypothetical protein
MQVLRTINLSGNMVGHLRNGKWMWDRSEIYLPMKSKYSGITYQVLRTLNLSGNKMGHLIYGKMGKWKPRLQLELTWTKNKLSEY